MLKSIGLIAVAVAMGGCSMEGSFSTGKFARDKDVVELREVCAKGVVYYQGAVPGPGSLGEQKFKHGGLVVALTPEGKVRTCDGKAGPEVKVTELGAVPLK